MLECHPSLDERVDPAIRIVPYHPAWPVLADFELRHHALPDYLRHTPGEVARYGELEQRVSARHVGDRVA